MKRSDMIEKMKEIYWNQPDDHGDFDKDRLMEAILTMQEDTGMLPPVTALNVQGVLVNEWDEEYNVFG